MVNKSVSKIISILRTIYILHFIQKLKTDEDFLLYWLAQEDCKEKMNHVDFYYNSEKFNKSEEIENIIKRMARKHNVEAIHPYE